MRYKTLIRGIGMLATPEGRGPRRGEEQGVIRFRKNAWLVVGNDGTIQDIGEGPVPESYLRDCEKIEDAGGKLMTPGLVDAHTHLVFGGWRENELAMKIRGYSYMDIKAAGGGIASTVRKTREATEAELTEKGREALAAMLEMGTTTCEAKSGYDLTPEGELKMLRAIRNLQGTQPVDVVPTFLGAHDIPEEYADDHEEYIRILCEEMMPAVVKENLAEFCDVFCEDKHYTAEESRRILEAGQRWGMASKIHADEIMAIGGSQVAGEVHAISAEHLIVCPDEGIEAMAKGGTIAVCLPATSFYLNATYARAKDMVKAGVPVAIATDYNPGSCPGLSLQFAMNLGCYKYRLTPEEVLTAVTLNAAAAINRADIVGSIEVGKKADLVLWKAENLNYIFYRFGSNLVDKVYKNGEAVIVRSVSAE